MTTRRHAAAGVVVMLAVAGLVVGVPFWPVMVGVVVATWLAVTDPARRHLQRRGARVLVLMLLTSVLLYVFIDVIPNASRSTRGSWSLALERYGDWVGDVVGGDLGFSVGYQESVSDGIARVMGPSLQIVVYSQLLALALVVPLSGWAAWHRGGWTDRLASTVSLGLLSVPIIVVGPLLVFVLALGGPTLFGVQWGAELFPAGLYEPPGEGLVTHLRSMTLPTVAMAAGLVGPYFVTLRVLLIEQMEEHWVTGAVARGLPPVAVMARHVLRPALPVFAAQVATTTTFLAGNLLLVERLFSIPGLGDYVLTGIGRRDTEAVVGGLFVMAGVLATITLIADTLEVSADPTSLDRHA
ncbi:MAG: ABC transporter permease [Actinomycetota bacterium]